MKSLIKSSKVAIFSVFAVALGQLLVADDLDDRPILKEPPAKLIEVIENTSRENELIARMEVARDAMQKRVRIFSMQQGVRSGLFTNNQYTVEVLYNAGLNEFHLGVGSYSFQHNSDVLCFAATLVASGDKSFGRWLIALLAEAAPELYWGNPEHPMVPVRNLLASLDKPDDTLKAFLQDENQLWHDIVRVYGQVRQEGAYMQVDDHLVKKWGPP
jgi:hypothetical protein